VLPVHLYGHPADVDMLRREAPSIPIVEDAAQAHGALYKGKRIGSLGDVACFSFYPTKNLGAYGEGGAVVTSDSSLATKVRLLRDHGQQRKDVHVMRGRNGRLHEIQAAILRVKLRHLGEWVQRRRYIAQLYSELLIGLDQVIVPREMQWAQHAYHLFVVRCRDREGLRSWLADRGIGSGIHYPTAVHLQPAFSNLGHQPGSLPVSEASTSEILSLPMFPELTEGEVHRVVDGIRSFYNR
jgi:dTDP-4-amino-4,6-dideoxygalactose transaminase